MAIKKDKTLKEFKEYLNGTIDYGISKEIEIEAIMKKFSKALDSIRDGTLEEMAKIKGVGVKTIEKCLNNLKTKNEHY